MTEGPQPIADWRRVDGIDLLRGLAIFFVLMNHVNMRLRIAKVPYAQGIPDLLVQFFVWNGQFGVQMFFAISGFLITSTAMRRWPSFASASVPGFYRLRFARIAPPLLALLAILSALHLAGLRDFLIQPKFGGLLPPLVSALTFNLNWFEARHGYLPGNWDVLWSLSVEEVFYFFFPLACWLLGRGKLFVTFLLCFVVLGPFGRTVFAHGNEIWVEKSYLGGMDAIALGCLTALLVPRCRLSSRVRGVLTTAGASLIAFILCLSPVFFRWRIFRAGLDMTILAFGTCMVIAVASQAEWRFSRVLQPLAALGRNSYEVYLTHMFVVFAFFDWFLAAGKPMIAVPAFFTGTILVSAALGAVIARFFSEPANRFLRGRSNRLSNQPVYSPDFSAARLSSSARIDR